MNTDKFFKSPFIDVSISLTKNSTGRVTAEAHGNAINFGVFSQNQSTGHEKSEDLQSYYGSPCGRHECFYISWQSTQQLLRYFSLSLKVVDWLTDRIESIEPQG